MVLFLVTGRIFCAFSSLFAVFASPPFVYVLPRKLDRTDGTRKQMQAKHFAAEKSVLCRFCYI